VTDKKIWEWTPQGRRRRGRPRRTWSNNIKEAMAALMSKISRTLRGGEEVARNVRKGCRTLEGKKKTHYTSCRSRCYCFKLFPLMSSSCCTYFLCAAPANCFSFLMSFFVLWTDITRVLDRTAQ
jgi:hypothetical protein